MFSSRIIFETLLSQEYNIFQTPVVVYYAHPNFVKFFELVFDFLFIEELVNLTPINIFGG